MNHEKSGILAIIGSSVAIFFPGALSFGYPGIMGPLWQDMFAVGREEIGTCLFFMLSALGFFMFWVGKLQEKYGIRPLIATGGLVCALALVVANIAVSIYMIYLWAFLNGIAGCLVYTPAMTVVQRWYPEHRGLVSGIVSMTFALSAAIMGPIFGLMLKTLGYHAMNWSMAIVVGLVGLAAAWFTAGPDPNGIKSDPENLTKHLQPPRTVMTTTQAAKTPVFWYIWLTWALQGAAGISMVVISVQFGLSKNFILGDAILILTAFNIMSALSRFITGLLSDIFGRTRIMLIAFWMAGLAYFALPWVNSLMLICVCSALVGFSFGTLFAVSTPLVSDCFGLDHFGAILGLIFTAYGFVSGVIGPSLSGYLLDTSDGNFTIVFYYLGSLCLLSGVIISRAKEVNHHP